jgi:hypothetical protein
MKRTTFMLAALGLFLFGQSALADWTPAKRITWTTNYSIGVNVGVDSSGIIHVVWEEGTEYWDEIYYKRSTDGGLTWTTGQRLTWGERLFRYPDLTLDSSGHLHVAWYDEAHGHNEIYYKMSPDGGATWTANRRLTGTTWSRYPRLAADSSDNPQVVWRDEMSGTPEIYYKKSADGGATWAARRWLGTTGIKGGPTMAIDPSDNIHVVWTDDAPGNSEVFYRKSTDGGNSWTFGRRLTWTAGASIYPALCGDPSGNLHLAWADDTPGSGEIYYKKSTDGGATWTPAKRITWGSSLLIGPDITADPSGNPHVVWMDDTSGNDEIYYTKSTNGGDNWSLSQRLTWNPGRSGWPDIATDPSGNVHVVWQDETPGTTQIYYKKYVK